MKKEAHTMNEKNINLGTARDIDSLYPDDYENAGSRSDGVG